MGNKKRILLVIQLLLFLLVCGGCSTVVQKAPETSYVMENLPQYEGEAAVEIDGGTPSFTEEELTTEPFETYSPLDSLGRCGVAYANICEELMPDEEREGIGQIKPTGWHTVKYPGVIADNYLYNRCHLIAYMLAGENANEKNLITGTRYFNVDGMLPYETIVSDYVHETGNHVLYRVTPVFEGDNLVADGVEMEAYSVEDDGAGVCFHVFVYNIQPGIVIDYATGESALAEDAGELSDHDEDEKEDASPQKEDSDEEEHDYVLNTNTKKFHLPTCNSVSEMKDTNKEEYHGTRASLIAQGYSACGNCNP